MNNQFFEKPILNGPYGYPLRHWELDADGQPTQRIMERKAAGWRNSSRPSPNRKSAGVAERIQEGMAPHEIGVFVRSEGEMDRARAAATKAGLPFKVLDQHVETASGQASISTMHLAKGLEFRAVAVMACDDEIIPLQSRIETVADDGDLEEVYNTERHLLYVACTRARDQLLVTSVEPASEFLDDLRQGM